MDAQTMEHIRTKLLNRREISLLRLETQALERIDASLDRMKNGTYGKCVVCRGAIETERLRAMPDVTRCAGCTH